MSRTRPTKPIACLLITVQVLLTLLGPAGLVLCHESDGSSHIELAVRGCCEVTPDRGAETNDPGAATLASQDLCQIAECRDVPLSGDLLAARARQGRYLQSLAAADCVVSLAAVRSRLALAECVSRPLESPPVTGPPEQTRHGLRSTVLML